VHSSDDRNQTRGSKTSALPNDELFGIDELKCMALARRMSHYRPRRKLTPHSKDARDQLALSIAITAICHQFNWDFLNRRLSSCLLDQDLGVLESIKRVSTSDFQLWFSDYDEPERIRAEERSRMLREIGRTLEREFEGDAQLLISRCNGHLAGPDGFFELMDQFAAYREDPLRKKTNVLIHELVRSGAVQFTDPEHIAPAIDYHLIRVYLRTGRVYPLHAFIFEDLATGDPRPRTRLVRVLREKVATAVKLTAFLGGLTVPDVNFIEWQLGRSICVRGTPGCISGVRARPLDSEVAKLFDTRCPYSENCTAFQDPRWLQLQEPVFKKTFY